MLSSVTAPSTIAFAFFCNCFSSSYEKSLVKTTDFAAKLLEENQWKGFQSHHAQGSYLAGVTSLFFLPSDIQETIDEVYQSLKTNDKTGFVLGLFRLAGLFTGAVYSYIALLNIGMLAYHILKSTKFAISALSPILAIFGLVSSSIEGFIGLFHLVKGFKLFFLLNLSSDDPKEIFDQINETYVKKASETDAKRGLRKLSKRIGPSSTETVVHQICTLDKKFDEVQAATLFKTLNVQNNKAILLGFIGLLAVMIAFLSFALTFAAIPIYIPLLLGVLSTMISLSRFFLYHTFLETEGYTLKPSQIVNAIPDTPKQLLKNWVFSHPSE